MLEGVLAWQAIIFFSIAFSGRYRGAVVGFWVVWTIFQVFALWLSIIQFGTIFVAWSLFCRSSAAPSESDAAPALKSHPARTPPPADDIGLQQEASFQQTFKKWVEQAKSQFDSDRWIPKSAVSRFLAAHPAPTHPSRTWAQAVGQASPEATLRKLFDDRNVKHLASQRTALRDFFRNIEKNPLTEEQILACICMDDAVMVVAAAGSGKTSTMVAKTGYALHERLASPDQILLLAFNRATADEVAARIEERLKDVPDVELVRSNTFHAFGIDVIAKATGRKPSLAPWVDPGNPGADVREVSDIIQTLSIQDETFRRDWDLFRAVYARDVGRWGVPDEPESFGNGVRGFRTANGEVVKSKEERTIADWLFYNGVAYEYERPYEHDTASEKYRQYFPDFFYPDAGLYHEHFALNSKGQPPKQFKGYMQGVEWKRQLHARLGTALFETTSHGLLSGEAIPELERTLVAHGIRPMFDPNRTVEGGLAPVPVDELARSFRVFQQHVKNNGLSHQQLKRALASQSEDGFGVRLSMYLAIYERIADEWQRRLRVGGFIDFEDMLIQAAEHVESGAYLSPYAIILADEFQDSSRARIRLLKALAANQAIPAHLCVVGDDWQGINRFAGSDISVMTEFEKIFDHATRLTLNTTFRCPKDVCDVSSEFIQKNPVQIRKQVGTSNPLTRTPLLAYGFQQVEGIGRYIEQQLVLMHGLVGEGKLKAERGSRVTVMLLGRYRDDRPSTLEGWQQRFGDRLKLEFHTAHGSKGLEAEYVFVLNVMEGTRGFPSQIQDDPALQLAMPTPDPFPFAEERRLFYVAMTRARRQVRFYTSLSQPSRFLVELVKGKRLTIQPIDGEQLEPCPDCGQGVLKIRPGRHGSFFGCSRFPGCNYTRKAREDESPKLAPVMRSRRITQAVVAGDACPVCTEGVLEVKNGRNGSFLGCSRFRLGCKATANIE